MRWIEACKPPYAFIENVPSFEKWGPVNSRGNVIKSREGETFHAWVNAIKSLGYGLTRRTAKIPTRTPAARLRKYCELTGFPVLTVADFDAFARRGGAIELKMVRDRVRFDINASAASAAGLHVSSKLLALAVHVYAAGEAR